MAVEFWFEFASTYSYPAAMRLEAVAAPGRVPIVWRPFLLGPIFAAQGWSDSPFNLYPAKGRYMWRDLQRICDREGLPLCQPSQFPRSGLAAARVAILAAEEPWLADFVRAVYRTNFGLDRNVADPAVIAGILDGLGLQGDALVAASASAAVKARLRAQTEAASARGIFGAPTFIVGDELFWGNDRLEEALAWHANHAG